MNPCGRLCRKKNIEYDGGCISGIGLSVAGLWGISGPREVES
jgi:hypothetical protein